MGRSCRAPDLADIQRRMDSWPHHTGIHVVQVAVFHLRHARCGEKFYEKSD